MATSSSVNFNQTANEIINDALVNCGAIAAGESPSADDTAVALRQLNRMVKTWAALGVRLWTRRQAYVYLSVSQNRYKLGPNSSDHSAEITDAADTALSADAASGASTITVDSVTNMAAADNIGVVLDDLTIDWDTIASISSTTITLDGTLSGAAATDQPVFAYTSKIARPLRIMSVERRSSSNLDTPISMISDLEYQNLPNKEITGLTNECYYHPELSDGFLYTWPEAVSAADRLRITCLFPVEDFDTTAHNPDLPQEWLDALVWNLARKLCPSYGTPMNTVALIIAEADRTYEDAAGWDREPEASTFVPDLEWGG
jgi:hypothetical protein